MRQHLLDLFALQQIDLVIRELERARDELPKRLKELEQSSGTLASGVKTLTDQRELLVKESKTLEGTVQAESHKVKKWEARLNEIRNQREYLALSREVEGAKRATREMEEKILEIAKQREELDKKLEGMQDQHAEEEVDAGAERDRVRKEIAGVNEKITAEASRRDAIIPKLPKPILKKYDAIRQKRQSVGIVSVVDGSCQGCNMRLPPQLYNILQRCSTLEQCPSCLRIMVWDQLLADQAGGAQKQNEKVEAAQP